MSTTMMMMNDTDTDTDTKHDDTNDRINKNNNDILDPYMYNNGFGNEIESECIIGALPKHRNNPRLVPYGLYCEQLSGTAFTISPRSYNHRTWTYRIEPSVSGRYYCTTNQENDTTQVDCNLKSTTTISNQQQPIIYFGGCNPIDCIPTIEPLRWNVPPNNITVRTTTTTTTKSHFDNDSNTNGDTSCRGNNFITGMVLMCTAGDVQMKNGINIYMYTNVTCNMNNTNEHLCNTDGEFLIVPQEGSIHIQTELGCLYIQPTEICVIPRGITFQVLVSTTTTSINDNAEPVSPRRGYVLEVSTIGNGLQLPELGPIGSNGLANGRDFQIPVAWCPVTNPSDYIGQKHIIYNKMSNVLLPAYCNHTPYNVIAWYGNYYPYKYNLQYFCTINSVSYDHLDPSIYTVLTCPSYTLTGVALCDFVIFPPRIIATDSNTFRPPWFHKNTMSEFMGLIYGTYDAKVSTQLIDTSNNNNNNDDVDDKSSNIDKFNKNMTKKRSSSSGFVPGGASLHNCMTPHGPDSISYSKAIADPCNVPKKLDTGMAFMFETYLPIRVAPIAMSTSNNWRDIHYNDCWQDQQQQQQQQQDREHEQCENAGLSHCNFTGWDLLTKQN